MKTSLYNLAALLIEIHIYLFNVAEQCGSKKVIVHSDQQYSNKIQQNMQHKQRILQNRDLDRRLIPLFKNKS